MSALDQAVAGLDLPLAFTRTWIAAFGLVVGSFLNVVIHRVPRGLSITRPRSLCPGCGRMIRWHENIPLVSWLLLAGRCAGCRAPISWRYPLVEGLTAALFLACHEVFGATTGLLFALPLAAATLALVFIDLEHLLLPDSITLPMTFAGLAASYVSPLTTPHDALLGVLLAWFALEGMNLAYKLLRGRDGFGGGDTKMMLMVAAFLGWQMTLFTLVAGSLLGVLVGLPALVWRRSRAVAPAPASPEPAAPAQEPADEDPDAPGSDADAVRADGGPPPGERGDEPPRLRELLPQSLDEALPLLLVPACASAWAVSGGSPSRALAGLLAGIALAWLLDLVLRARNLQSPASRALALAGPFAGLPAEPASLLAAAIVVGVALALFRPALLAPRPPRDAPEPPDAEPAVEATEPPAPLLQAELPFGVFLGAAALIALLAGPAIVAWYFAAAGPLLGMPPDP